MSSDDTDQTAAPTRPSRAAVVFAYATVYVVWGSTYLAIRFAVETLPPLLMAGSRFLTAGLVLYAWRRLARGDGRPARAAWGPAAVTGALLLLGGNGLVSWAEQRVPSGVAALLVTTTPLWVAIIDWARPGGARPTLRGVVGLLIGFAGVGLLVGPGPVRGEEPVNTVGAVAVVLAALSWATGSVYMARRKGAGGASPALGAGMQMICGGAMLLAVGLAVGEAARVGFAAVSARSAAAVAYLLVFGSLLAFSAYVWLLKVEPPARVATYAYVNPVVAVLLGWAFGGEQVGARSIAAMAVIVGAVVLITTSRRAAEDRKRSAATSAGADGPRLPAGTVVVEEP